MIKQYESKPPSRRRLLRMFCVTFLLLFTYTTSFGQVLSESFNGTSLPSGWTNEYVNGSTDWVTTNANQNSSITPHSGANMAEFRVTNSTDTTKLVTPSMDISSLINPQVTFYIANVNWLGDIDALKVYYKTSASGSWTLIPGATYTNEHTSWTEITLNLPNPSNDYYIAFEGISNYARGFDLDDVTVHEAPSCPKPSLLTASNIDANSADLGWQENGSATEWQIVWDSTGFVLGTTGDTISNISTNPYNLAGLQPDSTYDFYVRSVCGPGDTSLWVGPYTFTTPCSFVTVPFTQDFESVTTPAIPHCASLETNAGDPWITKNETSNFNSTVLEYHYAGTTADSWYFTQGIQLQKNVDYQIVYSYGNNSTSYIEKLKVKFGTSPASASMTNSIADYPNINDDTKHWDTTYFQVPSNGVYYFGFKAYSASGQFYLYVDDINIKVKPACPAPNLLTASNITQNSADLGWKENGVATEWQIVWDSTGFVLGATGDTISNISTNPYNLSGLQPDSTYDYYVRSVCGPGDTSIWSGPYTFTTPCSATTVPFTQDFESVTTPAIPHCASLETNAGSPWETEQETSNFNSQVLVYGYSGSTADSWYFTQGIQLQKNVDYQIVYSYGNNSTSYIEKLKVKFGTSPASASMANSIADYPNINDDTKHWDTTYFQVPSNGVYYFGFKAYSASGQFDLYVDDINIKVKPACPAPNNLTASNITQNSADLGWKENGSATEWQIEWDTTGFTQGTGDTISNITSKPYNLSGLQPDTSYDFYVRAVCGPGDTSTWSGPYTFTTNCGAATVPFTQDFESVTTPAIPHCASLETNSGNPWKTTSISGYSTQGLDYKYDFSDPADSWYFTQGIQLQQGKIYQISYNYGNLSTSYVEKLRVAFGTGNSSTSMTDTLKNYSFISNANVMVDTLYFQVSNNGVYYFGFQAHSDDNQYHLYLDNIDIRLAQASCIPPSDLEASNVKAHSATIDWTQDVGSPASWEIQYDTTGFALGTGNIVSASSHPFTLNGFNPSTNYDVYVRAVCGSGDTSSWIGPVSFLTPSEPFPAASFCENFNLNTSSSIGGWRIINANLDGDYWGIGTGDAHSGDYEAVMYTDFNSGNNDDYLVSPPIILTGQESMRFYYKVESSGEPNDFEVLLSTTGSSTSDFTDTLMANHAYSNDTYKDTVIDLTGYADTVYIAFHVPQGGLDGYRLFIDDVCFGPCTPTPGQDGAKEVCRADSLVDLSNGIITSSYTAGTWVFPGNPGLIQNGTDLNVSMLPQGTYQAYYLVSGLCGVIDTTVANITVDAPSQAGIGGQTSVCMNEPIDLFSAMSGTANLGGVWVDYNNDTLSGSNPKAPGVAGSYNYKYIVSNGVCPADEATIVVTVKGTCDYDLGIKNKVFHDITVYPNPTESILNIANPSNVSHLRYKLMDMKGRVVLQGTQEVNGSGKTTISVQSLAKGIYTLHVFNNKGQKTFKVVKK